MNKSENIAELAKALSVVQGQMTAAPMNATNPFLKNKYADLGSVIKASHELLSKNGLSVSQLVASDENKISVETMLMHTSGQFISSIMSLPAGEERGKSMAQVAGSIITYLRRYSLASILNMYADEDMDGNTEVKSTKSEPETQLRNTPAPVMKTASGRPYSPDQLKKRIIETGLYDAKATEQDRHMVAANLDMCFDVEKPDQVRHSVLKYLTGKASTKDISDGTILALKKWLHATQDSGGEWKPDPMAIKEAQSVWTEAQKADGQISLV